MNLKFEKTVKNEGIQCLDSKSQFIEVPFFIPDDMLTAKLIIHDLQGLELKSIDITQKGYGSITIVGSEFNAGIYLYSLLLNNKKIQTKRMILTKE